MTENQHPLTAEQAFDLAYEHPLTPDFARAAFDAGREHEREHGATPADPHRDPRPWHGPIGGPDPDAQINEGDLVRVTKDGVVRIARATRRDHTGRWVNENGAYVIPRRRGTNPVSDGTVYVIGEAVPPPLPKIPGAIIREVTIRGDMNAPFLVLAPDGCFYGDVTGNDDTSSAEQVTPNEIAAFTLPDGTRARRDGGHENGEPRFVKEGRS